MKQPAAASYIRQLCSLGLGGQVVMPELLRAMHGLIPSVFNVFLWADESRQISNFYSENSALYGMYAHARAEFSNSDGIPCHNTTFSGAMRTGRTSGNSGRLGCDFLAPEMYNNLIKPAGLRHNVEATIREKSSYGLGLIVLNRAPGDAPFSLAEEQRLHSVVPYIARCVHGTRDLRGALAASGESGTLIVDRADKVVQYCPEGRRLMLMAMYPQLDWRSDTYTLTAPALHRLCGNLRANLQGHAQPPPMLRIRNPWGEFILRAYPLGQDDELNGAIVVHIERHVPVSITLLRNMRSLSLTAREREVCLLLSYGYSHSRIGERMHVSAHTAADYVRKIYVKLDVHNLEDLLKKLMNPYLH
jgi:DNA-binding CsgD family transcriptional regulator